jgi:hypothetical protein
MGGSGGGGGGGGGAEDVCSLVTRLKMRCYFPDCNWQCEPWVANRN